MEMQRHIYIFFMFLALQQSSYGNTEDGILYIVLLLIVTSLTICSEYFDCLC